MRPKTKDKAGTQILSAARQICQVGGYLQDRCEVSSFEARRHLDRALSAMRRALDALEAAKEPKP